MRASGHDIILTSSFIRIWSPTDANIPNTGKFSVIVMLLSISWTCHVLFHQKQAKRSSDFSVKTQATQIHSSHWSTFKREMSFFSSKLVTVAGVGRWHTWHKRRACNKSRVNRCQDTSSEFISIEIWRWEEDRSDKMSKLTCKVGLGCERLPNKSPGFASRGENDEEQVTWHDSTSGKYCMTCRSVLKYFSIFSALGWANTCCSFRKLSSIHLLERDE